MSSTYWSNFLTECNELDREVTEIDSQITAIKLERVDVFSRYTTTIGDAIAGCHTVHDLLSQYGSVSSPKSLRQNVLEKEINNEAEKRIEEVRAHKTQITSQLNAQYDAIRRDAQIQKDRVFKELFEENNVLPDEEDLNRRARYHEWVITPRLQNQESHTVLLSGVRYNHPGTVPYSYSQHRTSTRAQNRVPNIHRHNILSPVAFLSRQLPAFMPHWFRPPSVRLSIFASYRDIERSPARIQNHSFNIRAERERH